jgi:hypothetical protein
MPTAVRAKISDNHHQLIGSNHASNIFYAFVFILANTFVKQSKKSMSDSKELSSSSKGGLMVFTGFSPMLSKGFPKSGNRQYEESERAMKGDAFSMEVKLDGERLLAHIGGKTRSKVYMHARRLEDFTDSYKPLGEAIRNSIKYDISCILDGEVLPWDLESKVVIPFGANKTVALEELKYEEDMSRDLNPPPLSRVLKYIVFDIVFLNGPDAATLISKHVEGRDKKSFPQLSYTNGDGDISSLPLAIRRCILEDVLDKKESRYSSFMRLPLLFA